MHVTMTVLPELILLGVGLLFLAFLALGSNTSSTLFLVWLGFLGALGAAVSAVFLRPYDMERILNGMLQHDPSFLYVRICLFVLAGGLILTTGYARRIEDARKPELCFFLLWITLFASVLMLSRHFLVSYLCLFGMASLNALLSAAPFQRHAEGKAALRYWFQATLCFTLGFGALVIMASQVDDLSYDSVRTFFAQKTGLLALPLVFVLLLPFWGMSGIFPFHHRVIELNQGVAWPIQAAQSLLLQGVGVLALFKAIVLVFFTLGASISQIVLYGFSILGFLGALNGGFGAISQHDGKRFAANFVLMQWSICLVSLGNPSAVSLSAALFYFLAAALGLAVCFIVWGGLLESRGSDALRGLRGARNRCLLECILLLTALVSLAGLPPFMGFPANLNMVAALFEQKEPVILLLYVISLVIQLVVVAKMLGLVFFAESDDSDGMFAAMGGVGTKLRFALVSLIAPLLLAGLFWESIWAELLERATSFINF